MKKHLGIQKDTDHNILRLLNGGEEKSVSQPEYNNRKTSDSFFSGLINVFEPLI